MKKQMYYAIGFLILTLIIATIGYKVLIGEDATYFDCFYMTIITLSTVGYGETVDLTGNTPARVFTIVLILVGMSNLIFVLTAITSSLIDGQLNRYLRRKKMKKIISHLNDHLIVCGAGNTGHHIIQELYNTKKSFVVIEENKDVFEDLQNRYLDIICIHGDATKDEVLEEAGVEHAKAIAAVLPYDKDNLFLTITAKQLNPNVRIISKIMNLENKRKLIRAGASSIVPPQFIGALRLVSEMVRPKVVGFLDNMLRDKKNLRIEEIKIPKNSWTIGKTLQQLDLRAKVGLQVLAFQDPVSQAYNYAPKSDDTIHEDMVLITLGEPDQIAQLEKFIG
ncbi:MAG: potassium channel protein [Candidatus Margulisbacteria bacterium]|jgi:voltage-gated potassium channel|nr:potassium channel protein [Candidatus Margulisiibacteriota bacterium]